MLCVRRSKHAAVGRGDFALERSETTDESRRRVDAFGGYSH